jgi:peptidyl-prolyl cis-trans isomerase SurA
MKKINLSVMVLATVALAGFALPGFARREVVERIIARVNSEIITERQFEQERESLRQELSKQYSGAILDQQFAEQSKNLLRDLIDQSLMVQKAQDDDINVETDLVKQLDQIRQENNLASLEDLQKEVEQTGISWEDFKEKIRRKLLMREVMGREVGRSIVVSREDARKFYDAHKKDFDSPGSVHLAEILISTEKYKPEEAEKRAKEALAALTNSKFNEIAQKYSDAPTAKDGGDIGFFRTGTLAPALQGVVDKLDVGESSGLIQTKYGYTILKVLERFSPGIATFDQVEQQIEEKLYNDQMGPALRKYLTQLRRDSVVYTAPGYIDSGADRPGTIEAARVP